MSTPMSDLPEHMAMPVNKYGQGPLDDGDPTFDRYECWCGRHGCKEFMK